MRPSQIYAFTTYKHSDLWSLIVHRDMNELQDFAYQIDHAKNTRVEVREVYWWCEDGRRIIRIDTVWLDACPVMILRRAGRDGQDSYDRYITSRASFDVMVTYLRSIANVEGPTDIVDAEDEIDSLNHMYGQDMRVALGIRATVPQ